MDDDYVPSDQLRIKKGTLFLVVLITSVVCVIGGVMVRPLLRACRRMLLEVIKEEVTEWSWMLAEDSQDRANEPTTPWRVASSRGAGRQGG